MSLMVEDTHQIWLWSYNRDRKRIEFMWNHRIRMKSSEINECFLLEFKWWAFMSPPTFPHLTRRTTGKHFHISTSTGTRAAFSQTHNTTSFNDIPLNFFIDISPLIVLTWMSCSVLSVIKKDSNKSTRTNKPQPVTVQSGAKQSHKQALSTVNTTDL